LPFIIDNEPAGGGHRVSRLAIAALSPYKQRRWR
jgi:hypothetical protein